MNMIQNNLELVTISEIEYECLYLVRDILLLSRKFMVSQYKKCPENINKILEFIELEIEKIIP